MDWSLLLTNITLFTGTFCLGGISILYYQRRTFILKVVLLFLFSIMLICLGFWLQLASVRLSKDLPAWKDAFLILTSLVSLTGLVLNVAVIPYLIAGLTSRSIEPPLKQLLWLWDGILFICGILFPLLSNPDPVITIMNIQLVVTIGAALIFLGTQLKSIPQRSFKKGALIFIILSTVFLMMLILDILVTRLSISALYFFDNLSLPFYILALSIGAFIFSGRVLNSEALMQDGHITDSCREQYGLTERESELIEALFEGLTNQELADKLFISKKTVENHLYNIYQKMEIKNRVQLMGTLKSWRKENRE
jgi:DNA-binding CsgD family transcriptional regulator